MMATAAAQCNVLAAAERLRGKLLLTPLSEAFWLGNNGARVMLKLESEQVTGSFKARGAMNKVLALTEEEKAKGLVTASTGNHALAVTHAVLSLKDPKVKFEVFLPETASAAKVEHLKAFGAPLRFFGKDCLSAEEEALRVAKDQDAVYISPYNDPLVLAGQGTVAVEFFQQLEQQLGHGTHLDAVFVPVGGGGLISGIAAHVKAVSPSTKVYGCCPKNDAHMAKSIKAGHLLPGNEYLEHGGETISEGTAGAVQDGSITFDICKDAVDEWIELTEEEIGRAVVEMLEKHHKAVEGAAGLGIAGYKKVEHELEGKVSVIVICGGNLKAQMMKNLLNQYLV